MRNLTLLLCYFLLPWYSSGFLTVQPLLATKHSLGIKDFDRCPREAPRPKNSVPSFRQGTPLYGLLNAVDPEYFMGYTMTMLVIAKDCVRYFRNRWTQEEAWEERLIEVRERWMREDPSLTRMELMHNLGELSYSAYGKQRIERAQCKEDPEYHLVASPEVRKLPENIRCTRFKGVVDPNPPHHRKFRLSQAAVQKLEEKFGVKYDPHVDDPYTEDELPQDEDCVTDFPFGNKYYQGTEEEYFEDQSTGLFWKKGALPICQHFW